MVRNERSSKGEHDKVRQVEMRRSVAWRGVALRVQDRCDGQVRSR
ncbi:hypothetical protein E2C01_097270 [Portunus trituberculatus]|uniref:Uncharacterized protein n=1 Tax=Portunus trituberculatus TaxID=210409 RepID=A0A5B7K427_PORTR|nr:hypothetical protein [Portunus trituberculatus]